jgi:D-glycero-D-manno-heptose 1,7-bisphosphate phosphatase
MQCQITSACDFGDLSYHHTKDDYKKRRFYNRPRHIRKRLSMRQAFFFDRDGIVNRRIIGGYVTTVDEFEFLPDVFPLFRAIKRAGWLAVLVTNQQGLGKGLMTEQDLVAIHTMMQREFLAQTEFQFDDIFFAGELNADTAVMRRKPSPAMLLEAAERWDINLAASWMLGDSLSDAHAGRGAGTRTVLVGKEFNANDADVIVLSLAEVISLVTSSVFTSSLFTSSPSTSSQPA